MLPAMPLVRPGEDERTGGAELVRRLQLAAQDPRLTLLPVARTVQADLGEDERAVAGEVLQAREVVLERLLLRVGPDAVIEAPSELAGLGRGAAERVLARYR